MAPGSPKPEAIAASWAFADTWDPERRGLEVVMPPALPFVVPGSLLAEALTPSPALPLIVFRSIVVPIPFTSL